MHSAHYDSNGDIILDTEDRMPPRILEEEIVILNVASHIEPQSRKTRSSGWTTIHEQQKPMPKTAAVTQAPIVAQEPKKESAVQTLSKKTKGLIERGSAESSTQLQVTAQEIRRELQSVQSTLQTLPRRIRGAVRTFWRNANTPVQLPSLIKKGKKPPTKLRLFIVDTIRFGGTFAGIFAVLFAAINFQSFFQIARAELALSSDIETQQGLEQIVDGTSALSRASDSLESGSRNSQDLLSFLPPVGPYEDRLIIPKLGENVPIVRPGMDALMHEDWKKFEDDIQAALHDGVVHYPGSAKPGQAGNFFVTGHSSYYPWDDGKYKDVFARLKDLAPGDTYSVYYGGDKHTYRVTAKKEVKPSDVSVLDQPTDKRLATLMTCTPVGTTLRRLIVTAEEIDPSSGEPLKVGERSTEEQQTPTARLESLPI